MIILYYASIHENLAYDVMEKMFPLKPKKGSSFCYSLSPGVGILYVVPEKVTHLQLNPSDHFWEDKLYLKEKLYLQPANHEISNNFADLIFITKKGNPTDGEFDFGGMWSNNMDKTTFLEHMKGRIKVLRDQRTIWKQEVRRILKIMRRDILNGRYEGLSTESRNAIYSTFYS